MVVANLVFTQNAVVGTAGEAYIGVVGSPVTLSNQDDTDVTTWHYEIMSSPYNSSVAAAVLSDGAAPTAAFTPDVSGSYRILEYVKDSSNNVSSQIRVLGVKNSRGWIVPAFDGVAIEHNFGGQIRGWVGDDSVCLVDRILDDILLGISDGFNFPLRDWAYDSPGSIATSVSLVYVVSIGTPIRFCVQIGTTVASNLGGGSGVYAIVGVSNAVVEPSGRLYVEYVDDGGGDFHANIYSRVGYVGLVGHTESYSVDGVKIIVADNDSGISGVLVVAVPEAGGEIVEFFRWGVVSAVSAATIVWDGAAIDNTVETAVCGDKARVGQLTAFISGEVGDDANTLATAGQKLHYSGPPARVVRQQFCANAVSGSGVTATWAVIDRLGSWFGEYGNAFTPTLIENTDRATSGAGDSVVGLCRVVTDDQVDIVTVAVAGGTATQTSANLVLVLE